MSVDGHGQSTYRGLRRMILDLDPVAAGMRRTPDRPRVWGAMMDSGHANGTITVACLADGTTSLYTSGGGGILGAGGHEMVALASRRLLKVAEAYVDLMAVDGDDDETLPGPDHAVLRVMTFDGRYAAAAEQDDFGYNRHPVSAVFHAFHEVITQLRLLDEARSDSN